MYWEEKIDTLKKKYSQKDFRDPFTDGPQILKKIESEFIVKKANPDYQSDHFNIWADIKNKTYLRTILRQAIYDEIKKLDNDKNYWAVIVSGHLAPKRLVYDCKLNSLESLLSMALSHFSASGDFDIVDKKYHWMVSFKTDLEKRELVMFKSGSGQTPFDI